MADEHTLIIETAPPIPFTVANGTGIEKGTLLTLSDPMTAAAATANTDLAGVLAEEKIASDGKTKAPVWREGIFKAKASGGITAGDTIAASGSNQVIKAVAGDVSSETLGLALETAAHGETFLYELKIGCNNAAYS